MADATASREDFQSMGDRIPAKMKGSTTLYAGTLVMADANGWAIKAADTSACLFLGVAMETKTNSSATDGAAEIVLATEGTFEFEFSGTATQAVVGDPCCAVDNQTVALAATTTNDVLVGKIVEFISATRVRVKI